MLADVRPALSRFAPTAASAATGVQVGAAIVATRFVIGQTSPASLALLRYAIGFCCLLPPALLARRVRLERQDLLPIALLGIVQFGVVVALLNFALQHISSTRTALIFATFPLLTMLLAAVLGTERLTLAKSLGVLVTLLGVGLALAEKALTGHSAPHEWIGALAVFASAVSGALCSVLYRPYVRKYPTLPVSALAILASVGFLAVLAAGDCMSTRQRRRGRLNLAPSRCASSARRSASASQTTSHFRSVPSQRWQDPTRAARRCACGRAV